MVAGKDFFVVFESVRSADFEGLINGIMEWWILKWMKPLWLFS